MTRSWWLFRKTLEYSSVSTYESAVMPGVVVTLRRMSLGRRIELAHAVRRFAAEAEFYRAGTDLEDRVSATLSNGEINAIYFRWGVVDIAGLNIDGAPATVEAAIASAPEPFVLEAAAKIKAECELSTVERKN